MKKMLLFTVGFAALGMAPAVAADLPARTYTKAPLRRPAGREILICAKPMNLGKCWQKGVSSARSRFRAKACPPHLIAGRIAARDKKARQAHRCIASDSIETIVRWRSSRLKISTIV
jgi:hypothetical protein